MVKIFLISRHIDFTELQRGLIAKLTAGKAALSLSQVEAPSGAGKSEGLLARGFAAIKGEAAPKPLRRPGNAHDAKPANRA